jgi:RNA polymerase sigma-70 factor, ECF subfamily
MRGAAQLAIERGGPEILGFLVAATRDEAEASEAFSQFCENVWVGLPNFEWRSSFRTWAYVLARSALRCVRQEAKRARRCAPLSLSPEVSALEEQVRTATLPFLRTESKLAVVRLRDELEPEDREILILRVDRDLPWDEVALITLGRSDADGEAVKREAARLRQRFKSVKEILRQRAQQQGVS